MFDSCAYKIVNTKMGDYLDDNFLSHYWHFNHGFKFENFVFNGFHDLKMLCLNISNTAVITVKNVDYRCIIHDVSKSEATHLFINSAFRDRGYI